MGGLAGRFWLRTSHKIAVKMLGRGLHSSEGLTGAGESASETAHSHGWRLEAQFCDMWASPEDCLSILVMWQMASPRAGETERRKLQCL